MTVSSLNASVGTITTTATKTISVDADVISSKTVLGNGIVDITSGSASLIDLSNISNDIKVSSDFEISSVNNGSNSIEISASNTLSADATIISGHTINGTGTLALDGSGGVIDMSNISSVDLTANMTGNTTFNNLSVDINASSSTGNITINETAGNNLSIITGSGNDEVNLSNGNDTVEL
ncbi:hypothetical protein B0174_12050, partial [Arcobacter caeni]